jgi:adenylosuccinate lyase
MMEATKQGGNRQALHEIIRKYSMEATAKIKEGENCNLLELLSLDPVFSLNDQELKEILNPQQYIGRCPEQVEKFLKKIMPMLSDSAGLSENINL